MPEFNAVIDKVKKAHARVSMLETIVEQKLQQKEAKTSQLRINADTIELDTKVIEVFKRVIEQVSLEGLTYVKGLVTRGLQTVFTDDVYAFDIEISDRGANKTVEFFIEDSRGVRSEISCCGGGIQAVVSFIFQVYFILKMKLPRVLFLDEAFARLSIQYADGLFEFISALKTELGFKVLWITHAGYFADKKVDRIYEVKRGTVKCVSGN